ncbi:MAG: hypothetical protein GF320_02260 [Armatimonadia bacterium]|nr:hypothetical protein [Armatimonadia bacterium]
MIQLLTLVTTCVLIGPLSMEEAPAMADISIEDGREILLDLLPAAQIEGGSAEDLGPMKVARYDAGLPDGSEVTYIVNLTEGRFQGFVLREPPADADSDPMTDGEALDLARSTAERLLGTEASELTWEQQETALTEDRVEFKATGEPVRGEGSVVLPATCRVSVDLAAGVVAEYHQRPSAAVKGEVMSEASAVSVALAEYGQTDGAVVEKAELYHHNGQALWSVLVSSAQKAPCYYSINALTGAVVTASPGAGVPSPGGSKRAAHGREAQGPLVWWVAGSAAVLLIAGAVLVLLRRRSN